MEILENIPLALYTSIRIGGPARFFCVVKNEQDLNTALEFAREKNLPVLMLGGGCNSLFPDKGIDGLVIKMQNTEFKQEEDGRFIIGAGVGLGFLAQVTAKLGFAGAEWCTAVPGTVGGAVYGNAGAFGGEMKYIAEEVEFFDKFKVQSSKFKVSDCEFDYRESVFKKHPEWIIWSAVIQLRKGDVLESQKKVQEYLAKKRQGQDLENKSAGCTFKNPKLPDDKKFLENLRESLELEQEEFNKMTKTGQISAGFLIDRLDLKGKKIGGIQISPKHANFLINTGGATAEDTVIMISFIKEKIRNHYDIQLHEEIQLVGFPIS
ncbi:MAG: UDP-N-acetylmuramate dehydrogenase [Patescibacteria group bacterium]